MSTPTRIAVVTDSTSDIPLDMAERAGITIVPLNIHFGSEAFKDQVEMTTDEFMQRMASSDTLPTTSQPSAGAFEEVFRKLAADHDEIIVTTLSERLSSTYQTAVLAAKSVDGVKIHVVDSESASWSNGYLAFRALELIAEGKDGETIAQTLRNETGRYQLIFFVETLEHLRRGGRIGIAAQLVGSLLQLRPLLRVEHGQIVPFERARTRRKATRALIDYAREFDDIEAITVLWDTTPDDAEALKAELESLLPSAVITTRQLGPVIATHIGPDVLGLVLKERLHD